VNLLIFGYGYTSGHFVRQHGRRFASISATVRGEDKARAISADGVRGLVFDGQTMSRDLADTIQEAEAVLVSVPPDGRGDPVLRACEPELAAAPRLGWVGYLSTVGVYGDHGGDWVTEETPPRPVSERSVRRVEAENAWLSFGRATGKAVMIFRLAGIYGPGQNALVNLREGTAKRLVKPGQVFNRIHVEDIAGAIAAGLDRPRAGAIWNVTDDEPAPPQDVVTFAAELLGIDPPPEQAYETADLSPMARSFYGENKRVSNAATKAELGWTLRYPTYREAHRALLEAGGGR
jgi:nucleoside-diphosphate-sugar epimerase